MDEENKENLLMTPDEEVAMILSSNEDNGPSTSKRPKLISKNQAGTSRARADDVHSLNGPSGSREIGHGRHIWDSSDSDSSSPSEEEDTTEEKVYPNVEAYLSSIPEFDVREHRLIPYYMGLLGDNARYIRTVLPTSDSYTAEEMENITRNFILSQLDFLIRENVRRTTKEARTARKESKRLSLIKPLAKVAQAKKVESDSDSD